MSVPRSKKTGNFGEDIAVRFMEAKGWRVVTRNFRYKRSEIDLIVQKDRLLVFVEVKTRSNLEFGEPESFVSPNQRRQIHAAAGEYIYQTDWQYDIRFDVIAITLGSLHEVLHIEDAFY